MPTDKEIKIRAILDSASFDKGVNDIQNKLKRMTSQTSTQLQTQQRLEGDSVLGKYAQQAFGDFSKDNQQNLQKMYTAQRQEAVNQNISMKGKQAELDKLKASDTEMT
jgi:hypothetical protein